MCAFCKSIRTEGQPPGGVSLQDRGQPGVESHQERRRRERIDSIVFFGEAQVAPPAEAEVAAQQEIEAVLSAIEELPAKCRNAFVMYRFYCHELADIARSMSISERMVRIYIERAAAFCYERLLGTGGGL
jgi:DNA-directed RNA polymerase specialized sigma24 family protein